MNLIVRLDDFLVVGRFNQQLETAEDVDLCYRLGQRGTILSNPWMEAIHWGEAQNLRAFWRKEVWRGTGNVQEAFIHGFRRDEMPSLGYPLYILIIGVLFCLSLLVDDWRQRIRLAPLCLVLLILPALLFVLRSARSVNRAREIPRQFLFYFIYGIAQAYSIAMIGTTLLR